MPEETKNVEKAPDQTSDSPPKSPFSAAEALLASIAVILLLVIIVYSFFHADRQADPVIVYLAESSGSGASAAASTQFDAAAAPELNLAAASEAPDSEAASMDSSASTENAIPTVNINTASVSELTALPGIGEVKAAAIIAYREEFGSFLSVSQLLNVSGIGEKTLEKIRDYIVLS